MNALYIVFQAALILAAGFFFTTKLLPLVFVRAGKLLGFRMQLTPLTAKRIARFKRIKRGYYAFLVVSTLFVLSLFLELFVNDRALFIRYKDKYAFPAVSDWVDRWVPEEWMRGYGIPFPTISSYNARSKFGLPGDEPVDYRKYKSYCKNPELIKEILKKRQAVLKRQRESLDRAGPAPEKPAPVEKPPEFTLKKPPPPGPGASSKQKKEYGKKLSKWKEAREKHQIKQWEYDDYVYELRAWKNYRRKKEIVQGIEREVATLKRAYKDFKSGKAMVLMPLYPYGPQDSLVGELTGHAPHMPSWWPYVKSALTGNPVPQEPEEREKREILPVWSHPFGTTDNGLDVFPQLAYGFRSSLLFALIVAAVGYVIGVIVGGIMGYYGGWTDIIVQRFIEIYGSIPFLYTIMIMASIMQPSLLLLAALLIVLRSWIGITYYVRGEFYREKAKDYVRSAIGTGVSDWKVMTSHILPNSLVPVVTFMPFDMVTYILTLVSLDYLGFGLPPGSPSWGVLLRQGSDYLISYPHLILAPSLALAATLFCVVVVGESVREAFDPKVFSRLR